MITDIVENSVDTAINDDMDAEEWSFNELNSLLLPIVPIQPVALSRVTKKTKNGLSIS